MGTRTRQAIAHGAGRPPPAAALRLLTMQRPPSGSRPPRRAGGGLGGQGLGEIAALPVGLLRRPFQWKLALLMPAGLWPGWLSELLAGRLAGWLAGGQAGRRAGGLADWTRRRPSIGASYRANLENIWQEHRGCIWQDASGKHPRVSVNSPASEAIAGCEPRGGLAAQLASWLTSWLPVTGPCLLPVSLAGLHTN